MIYFCGSSIDGQSGVSISGEILPSLTPVTTVPVNSVSKIICSMKETYVLTKTGEVYSAGNNDSGNLGRQGKRSAFARLDAIEHMKILDVSSGQNFCLCVTDKGGVIGWGANEFGQLGCGNRDVKEKPRPISITEPLLQLCSGDQHNVALTNSGDVLLWGGNRKGQLGDGQLTSSCSPLKLPQLRYRPIVRVVCGENHTIAMTVTGNLFVWGDNTSGQLGLGDTVNRLRPEPLRFFRSSRVSLLACGRY
jgi:E3 ubiquitin-protein ligase HERC4